MKRLSTLACVMLLSTGTPGMGDGNAAVSNDVMALLNDPNALQANRTLGPDCCFNVVHYGADGSDDKPDTAAVRAAIDAALAAGGGTVYFPTGTYRVQIMLDTPSVSKYKSVGAVSLEGAGAYASRLMAVNNGDYAISIADSAGWENIWSIRNLGFYGQERTYGGVRANVSGVLGCHFENCSFFQCTTGFKNQGSLYYTFSFCSFVRCDYGVWLEPLPAMHGGCAWFDRCNWYINHRAAVYVHAHGGPASMEQVRFTGGINEGNLGYAFFVEDWRGTWPLVIEDFYLELNGQAETVDVNGGTYEPNDIYLQNCHNVRLVECKLGGGAVDMNDSTLYTSRCYIYSQWDFNDTGTSAVYHDSPFLDGIAVWEGYTTGMPQGYKDINGHRITFERPILNSLSYAHRNLLKYGSCAVPFTPADANGLSYCFVVGDAPVCSQYMCVTLPGDADRHNDGIRLFPAFPRTQGKYYVWSFDVRSDTNDVSVYFMSASDMGHLINAQNVQCTASRWRRYYGIGKAAYSGPQSLYIYNRESTQQTYSLANFQLVQFDTQADAFKYIYDGLYAWPQELPKEYYDDVALTADHRIVSAKDNGKYFSNAGARGIVAADLAPATVGQRYTFTRMATHAFRVNPDGQECFRGRAPGEYLELDSEGDSVTLQCLETGVWDIVASHDANGTAALFSWERQ